MIKRLDLSRPPTTEEWPSDTEPFRDRHLFAGRAPLRKLVVMVDAELMDETSPPPPRTPAQLLAGLVRHPLVTLLRYSDSGAPEDVAPRPAIPLPGAPTVRDGWIGVPTKAPNGEWAVVIPRGSGFAWGGVAGNVVEIAERDTRSAVYGDLGADEAAQRRRSDALAAQIAVQALHADLYVSERPYLHAADWSVAQGVTLCTTIEALGVLSLYLRAQGVYPLGGAMTFDRGLFYWVGTRELLPAAWRWHAACVQHASAVRDDALMLLSGSLLERFDRALRARDRIQVALNQPQNNNVLDEALMNLDVVLVLLMASVDVAARVAHRVLQLPSDEYLAAWQRKDWIKEVRRGAPALAAQVDKGTTGEGTLTVLRLLRNSVHSEALQGLAVRKAGDPLESLVGLPSRDAENLRAAMEVTGGASAWGAQSLLPGRLHVDPGVFADRLVVAVAELLGGLMALTPVESLPHVDATSAAWRPPDDDAAPGLSDPFAPWIRQSIRWQLGF